MSDEIPSAVRGSALLRRGIVLERVTLGWNVVGIVVRDGREPPTPAHEIGPIPSAAHEGTHYRRDTAPAAAESSVASLR